MMQRDTTLEFTFWKSHNIKAPEKIPIGTILAITSASVTEFMDHPQLESSAATTIIIDPKYSDVMHHVNRLHQLMLPTGDQPLALAEILTKNPYRQPNNYRCSARIHTITPDTKWFYVLCPECPNHMHPQKNSPHGFSCEDHHTEKPPNFMYCLNATITDDTSEVPAVFFNDAATALIGIPCSDLIKRHGYNDPRNPPPQILTVIGETREMMVTIKSNRTLAVNSVKKEQPTLPLAATDFDPATPATKAHGKRPMHEQGTEEQSKKRRL